MMNPRSLFYTVTGVTLFVILPFFMIASAHIKKGLPGRDCTINNISGKVLAQYEIQYPFDVKSKNGKSYHRKSKWIPLRKGSRIGSGALIKTEEHAFIDLMIEGVAAFRINKNSLIKFEQIKRKHKNVNIALNSGELLCRIIDKKSAKSQKGLDKCIVTTPTATIRVKGTTFYVNYFPSKKITKVAVLDGAVNFNPNDNLSFGTTVYRGKQAQIAPVNQHPYLENITPHIRDELLDAKRLKFKSSGIDQWNQIMDLVVASPFYNKALKIITNYEMKIFKRAIIYHARLLWNNTVPSTLQAIELEDGDYADPWDTEYLYEKIEEKKAALISAGPDKIYHTPDDIFMSINL